jgi:hypothetical protein
MPKLPFFVLLASVLFLSACSSGGSDSPSDSNAHPQSWFSTHAEEALADPGYDDCTACHGSDLLGRGNAVSCFSCHSYNEAPPFSFHPEAWVDAYIDHRGFAALNGTATCNACHGQDLRGRQTAPSCFSAGFDGRSCHADGPQGVPHPLDGSYLSGANHGPNAKADLASCQVCHGQAGGPGSNPRFNIGIIRVGGNGCESCHNEIEGLAHPQNWAGPNPTFHYSADNIQTSCTLCHGVNLDGVGAVGVSCIGCHDSATDFTLDCTFCHAYPPDGSVFQDVPIPVPHGDVALITLHGECFICHGMLEDSSGGRFSATINYALFDEATDTIGDHWDGNINMSADFQYNQDDFGCDAAGCHFNDPAHRLSDSGLPVTLEAYFGGGGGGGGVHALDGSFLLPSNHGPAAKGLTSVFPNGMLDCQPCHAQTGGPGSNPRFNVGINSQGGIGCEGCHNDFTAHPAAGGTREDVPWYDVGVTHSDVNGFSTMCALCHGATLGGGIGPACTNCHTVDPVANPSSCISCHNTPPDGAVRPNREGRHGEGRHQAACATCHDGVGVNTVGHFDQSPPADVVIQAAFGEPQGAGVYDPTTGSCSNITCHGGSGTSEGPWYQ